MKRAYSCISIKWAATSDGLHMGCRPRRTDARADFPRQMRVLLRIGPMRRACRVKVVLHRSTPTYRFNSDAATPALTLSRHQRLRSITMARLRAAASVSAMIFTTLFLASASLAGPVDHVSSLGLRDLTDSSLILQVKSEQKCKWKRVCDYFAPESSCSHPPCCKKSHHEKVCEDTTSDKGTSQTCPDGMVGTPPNCVCTSSQGVCQYLPH